MTAQPTRTVREVPDSLSPLACAVRGQRSDLGLSVGESASLAGLSLETWQQLEAGTWVPNGFAEVEAVARGIRDEGTMISFLAEVSHIGIWKQLYR